MRKLVGVIAAIQNAIGAMMWALMVREYSRGRVPGVATTSASGLSIWLVFFSSTMVGLIAVFFFLFRRRYKIPSLLFAVSLLGGVASLWIGLRSLPFFSPMILIHPLYAGPVLNCAIALYSLDGARRARGRG